MHRDLEKDLIEIEAAIKSNEERGNTFTVSVLQRAYERIKATQWIPCRERLPEEYGDYLIIWTDIRGEIFYEICEYEPNDGWIGDITQAFNGKYSVIAWMPLPEPYKGAEHE